jgi:CubicO group peptidase (beta-lactamase class C family)
VRILSCVWVLLLVVSTVCAQTARKRSSIVRLDGRQVTSAEVDSNISRLMSEAKVAGLAVAVINRGEVVYLRSFGYRDLDKHLSLEPDTVMYGASFTKSMFAFMVMQLVEEGVLDLDKPVYQYLKKPLPEYEKYKDLAGDERYKKLTARMLLDHTSGFPNWRFFNDDRKLDIKFEPGTKFAYSGEGIDLLQLVIEEITGQSVGDLMQKRVFDRFGMTRTSMTWQRRFESNYANGHDERGKVLAYQRRKSADAAGSLATTIGDVAKLVQGVIRREGLKESSWHEMFRTQVAIHSKHEFPTMSPMMTNENDGIKLSYGLGFGLYWTPTTEVIFKEGHDDGWENHLAIYEKNRSAVILMSNSSNGDSTFKELIEYLAGDRWMPWKWEGYVPYQQLKNASASH